MELQVGKLFNKVTWFIYTGLLTYTSFWMRH